MQKEENFEQANAERQTTNSFCNNHNITQFLISSDNCLQKTIFGMIFSFRNQRQHCILFPEGTLRVNHSSVPH